MDTPQPRKRIRQGHPRHCRGVKHWPRSITSCTALRATRLTCRVRLGLLLQSTCVELQLILGCAAASRPASSLQHCQPQGSQPLPVRLLPRAATHPHLPARTAMHTQVQEAEPGLQSLTRYTASGAWQWPPAATTGVAGGHIVASRPSRPGDCTPLTLSFAAG